MSFVLKGSQELSDGVLREIELGGDHFLETGADFRVGDQRGEVAHEAEVGGGDVRLNVERKANFSPGIPELGEPCADFVEGSYRKVELVFRFQAFRELERADGRHIGTGGSVGAG